MGINWPTDYDNSSKNDQEAKWNQFVEHVFKKANLPEVDPSQLEAGTYTNAVIAQAFRHNPEWLVVALTRISHLDPATKRSMLSFQVEILQTLK